MTITSTKKEVVARSEWVTLGQDVGDALDVSQEQEHVLVTAFCFSDFPRCSDVFSTSAF